MFTNVQSDVASGKKTANTILDILSKNPSGAEMDALLLELLKDTKLDADNPVNDAIARIKAIVNTMFDKITKDTAATRTAALLLLDHLPGHSMGED